MIQIGIIGCGTMAERHINAYRKINDVNVKAVCDIDFETAKFFGNKYGLEHYKDYKKIIEDENINGIDVCVPTYIHHKIILKALKFNKHIFCEKPLTHKLEYIEKIKKEITKNKNILMTGYLYNFHPSYKMMKNVLKDNIIGIPYFGIFRIGGRGSRKIWKHKKKKGGGALLEMMVHMLEMVSNILNPFDEIENIFYDTILKERLVENTKIKADAEDCVIARLKTKNGANIFCEADLITPSYMNYIEIHGDNGSFFGSILDYLPTMVYCKENRGLFDKGRNFFTNPPVDLVREELEYFIKVIKGLEEPIDSINNELHLFKLIEEIRKQAGIIIE